MENPLLDSNLNISDNNGGLNGEDRDNLLTAAKWSRFLGIVGYVGTALIALVALVLIVGMSTFSSAVSETGLGATFSASIGIFYLFFAAIQFFISKYLYNFGISTRQAIESNSANSLSDGFKNLKSFFSLIGIMTAVLIGLYALIFVFALIGGGFAAMAR